MPVSDRVVSAIQHGRNVQVQRVADRRNVGVCKEKLPAILATSPLLVVAPLFAAGRNRERLAGARTEFAEEIGALARLLIVAVRSEAAPKSSDPDLPTCDGIAADRRYLPTRAATKGICSQVPPPAWSP